MNAFETYALLSEPLFRAVLGAAKTGSCLPDRALCSEGSAFDAMVQLVDISNHVVSLAAAATLTGIILALAHNTGGAGGMADRAAHIREARTRAKRYLYCAGVLLTAGMLWTQAWMVWPAGAIAEESLRAEYKDMVNAFSIYRGVTFSLLILSVYLPVYLVLSVRVDAFWQGATDVPDGFEADEALDRISYTEALKTITAILAPILMSVFGSAWNITLGV